MAARILRQTVQFLHIAAFRERFDQERTSAPKLSGASEFRATRLGSRLSLARPQDRLQHGIPTTLFQIVSSTRPTPVVAFTPRRIAV